MYASNRELDSLVLLINFSTITLEDILKNNNYFTQNLQTM